MKLLIEKWQKFLDEAMKTEPPEGYIVIISGDRRQVHIKIRSREKVGESPRFPEGRWKYAGEIHIERSITVDDGAVYEVESVVADEGYGPLLYDIAMEMTYLLGGIGLIADRRSISHEAKNIWLKYYNERQDVEHKPLPEDMFVGKLADRPEYLRNYYFKNDTPVIERLKQADKLKSNDFDI